MAQKAKMSCPVCGKAYTNTWYDRHLIKEHDYIYLDGYHAVPKPNWWRPGDTKGHFIKASF